MTENKLARTVAAVLAAVMLCACLLPALIPFARRALTNSAGQAAQAAEDGEPRAVTLREGDCVLFGAYRDEPLLWQVAGTDGEGRSLLLADAVICFKAFDVPADRTVRGSSDWDACSLKRWLNSDGDMVEAYREKGFLSDGNFTAAQRGSIAEPGVFIPSREELKNAAKYVSLKKLCRPGAADSCSYLVLPSQSVWYWTRTPNTVSRVSVAAVNASGGFYKTLAGDADTGVCPALFLNSPTVTATGDGSERAPYFITEGGAAQ